MASILQYNLANNVGKDVTAMREIKRVLVIDDEMLICKSVKKIFATENIETDIATRGRDGLIKARSVNYDLVLIDIQMPEMNGYAVVRMLREIDPVIPIFVISGYNTPHTKEEALKCGANEFIPKPFLPEEVLDRVKKVFEGGKQFVRPVVRVEQVAVTESGIVAKRDSAIAVGYACEVATSSGPVSVTEQKISISKYAADKCFNLTTIYEDEPGIQDVLRRPAIREILDSEKTAGTIVVERVWSLARNRRSLREVLEVLDRENITLRIVNESMMDCVSQFARRWYENREALLREFACELTEKGEESAVEDEVPVAGA
jgi:DNA-binding response OmpR family regulator